MSIFVPTWHTKEAGENIPTSCLGKPGKAFFGLSGDESKGVNPQIAGPAPKAVGAPGGQLVALDEDGRRRHEERAVRKAAALAEQYCSACGFSFWRVSPRGDASCYGCALLREGKPLRCARCGLEVWRRDARGRRVCATCHGGDVRGAAPSEIAAPKAMSGEFSAPGGAA